MSSKNFWKLIAALIVIGIITFEFFLEERETSKLISTGRVPKVETNLFLQPSSTNGQIVHHNYYSLSYNEDFEQAEWVAYELKKDHLFNTEFKRPYFEIDQSVKTGAADWRNYKNSGFDRGHLCPAADRRFSQQAYNETFLTSNISPQDHQFNSGVWNRLEQKVRYWAKKYDGVYVVTGGVLKNGLSSIGEEKVAVPEQFYKILIDLNSGQAKMIAFLLPHQDSDRPLYEFVVTVDSVESLTGIDFFPKLEDELEERLEKSSSYKNWMF